MSSKRQSHPKSGKTEPGLCRLGERVLLVAPGDQGDTSHDALGRAAMRHLDIVVEGRDFRLLQFLYPAELEAGLARREPLGLLAFLDRNLPEAGQRIEFLKDLFDIAVRMLRLQDDARFVSAARDIETLPGLPFAYLHLDTVAGLDTAIATIPARARFQAEDIFVSFSETRLTIGKIEASVDFLGEENERQKLAVIAASGPLNEGAGLLIGTGGIVRLECELRRAESLAAFHKTNARQAADRIALLIRHDAAAAAVLNMQSRRAAPADEIIEPQLAFRLIIDVCVSLASGLFVSGWYYDPEERLSAVIAVDHSLDDPELMASWSVFDGRADIDSQIRPIKRFAVHAPRLETAGTLQASVPLRIVLSNGESHILLPQPVASDAESLRAAILGSIAPHALTPEMMRDIYSPAVGPLQEALNARQSVRQVKAFGPRSVRRVSIIIPLYKEIGFIRSQLMAFSTDPYIRDACEIVYVLDDPLIALKVSYLLQGASPTFPLDIRLVILERNGGYALANNFGAGEAEGETLILMNSDVIPGKAGWIEPALARLSDLPAYSVIGPKLLYADGSLQHAGMYFHRHINGCWQNYHYWKGYAGQFEPAGRERVVPAVTGACMILRRADFLDVEGFSSDYVVGDYEDSDLCLKLRDRGGLALYMPSLELYHFERQSMPDETDQRDRGSTVYNRMLHTLRWDEKIDAANAAAAEAGHG